MKEQYVNNINTHKEVLNALPKNNEKNIKAYKNKVSELLILYKQDLTSIIEEIDKNIRTLDTIGQEIVEKYGEDKLKEVAKLNFANTQRILKTVIF